MGKVFSTIQDEIDPVNNNLQARMLLMKMQDEMKDHSLQLEELLKADIRAMRSGESVYGPIIGDLTDIKVGYECYEKSGANSKISGSIDAGLDKHWKDLTQNITGEVLDILFGSFEGTRRFQHGYKFLYNGANFRLVLYKTYKLEEKQSHMISKNITAVAYAYCFGLVNEQLTSSDTLKNVLEEYKFNVVNTLATKDTAPDEDVWLSKAPKIIRERWETKMQEILSRAVVCKANIMRYPTFTDFLQSTVYPKHIEPRDIDLNNRADGSEIVCSQG